MPLLGRKIPYFGETNESVLKKAAAALDAVYGMAHFRTGSSQES